MGTAERVDVVTVACFTALSSVGGGPCYCYPSSLPISGRKCLSLLFIIIIIYYYENVYHPLDIHHVSDKNTPAKMMNFTTKIEYMAALEVAKEGICVKKFVINYYYYWFRIGGEVTHSIYIM
jgi:hypothetical protein